MTSLFLLGQRDRTRLRLLSSRRWIFQPRLTVVKLITKGEKVNRSAAELLVMLNIKPFYYGITVHHIYANGDVFPADVLDISASDIAQAFSSAVREVAALCLALNYPTAASVPHSIMDAHK